ncbi:tRNA 2-thiouridine(34) synthase MnmA [Bacteroides sp. KG68]|uniref:tRNA 2-thiouridine(34) synthase MnmA n=1 Tax=unclassified Bacteroides TaxID=2646097 RepID=UPI003D969F7C
MNAEKRVLLGMSGGTDSSVAAMKLQEEGYEVTGVTFRFYEHDGATDYLDDARRLAARLGMEHITCDAREVFRSRVIRYFTDEYLSGRTPVPCIVCNNELKWALLAKTADEKGIYWISTGHYARKVQQGGKWHIAPAADRDKDQTFFLWGLKQDILRRMLLPLGDITKGEARDYAADRGFPHVATKKDSIGVCFCPLDYRSFLRREVEECPKTAQAMPKQCPSSAPKLPGKGRFVDEKGDFLGWHEGYPFYTVGQRRGLGIHLNRAVYVKETRPAANEVVLAPLSSLYKQEMLLKEWNLTEDTRVIDAAEVIVKIRYRKQANRCKVSLTPEGMLHVSLTEPLEAVAPGQAAAFYDTDGLLLGGGIIV